MIEGLRFRRLGGDDQATLAAWFTDPVLARRVSPPDAAWLRYVLDEHGPARVWVGEDAAGRLVCEVQVDTEGGDSAGYVEFILRPDLRGQGLGAPLLAAFLAGPGAVYRVLVAEVERDNIASRRCCERCGFESEGGASEKGFVRLVRRRPLNNR